VFACLYTLNGVSPRDTPKIATLPGPCEQANGAVLIVHPAETAEHPEPGLAVDDQGRALEPFGASGDLTWFFPARPA
jgi:hypothetical protein